MEALSRGESKFLSCDTVVNVFPGLEWLEESFSDQKGKRQGEMGCL